MSTFSANISHKAATARVSGIDGESDRDLCRVQIQHTVYNVETEEYALIQSAIWGTPAELFAFAREVDRAVAELVAEVYGPCTHGADCTIEGHPPELHGDLAPVPLDGPDCVHCGYPEDHRIHEDGDPEDHAENEAADEWCPGFEVGTPDDDAPPWPNLSGGVMG